MARKDEQVLRARAAVRVALSEIVPIISKWNRHYPGFRAGHCQTVEILNAAEEARAEGGDPVAVVIGYLDDEASFIADATDDDIAAAVRRALDAVAAVPEPTLEDAGACVLDVPFQLFGLVAVDSRVSDGKPCVAGTETPLVTLFDDLTNGKTLREIADARFPRVPLGLLNHIVMYAGAALLTDVFAPLIGPRRRDRETGEVYEIVGVIGRQDEGDFFLRTMPLERIGTDDYGAERAIDRLLRDPRLQKDGKEVEDASVAVPASYAGIVEVDIQRIHGIPCFSGTRVPLETLFENLADDTGLDEVLECWAPIDADAARRALHLAGEALAHEALSPLVGQRRRRADGVGYRVERLGVMAFGDWVVHIRLDDGSDTAAPLHAVLEHLPAEDADG